MGRALILLDEFQNTGYAPTGADRAAQILAYFYYLSIDDNEKKKPFFLFLMNISG